MEEQQLVYSKAEIDRLIKQGDYLVETIDKLLERFNGMGRTMMENNAKLNAKIDEKVKPSVYTVRPNKSDDIGLLSAALSKAQKEIGAVIKGESAYRGKFSSLVDMLSVTAPVLEKYEVSVSCLLGTNEQGEYTLTMTLLHSSDQFLETTALLNNDRIPLGKENLSFHQNIAAAEKMLRRYMYRSILNLAEDSE